MILLDLQKNNNNNKDLWDDENEDNTKGEVMKLRVYCFKDLTLHSIILFKKKGVNDPRREKKGK